MNDMFCFQCEQTAGTVACTKKGVCGKASSTANFQDNLIGALVSLAKAVDGAPTSKTTDTLIIEGLFTTITNVNFNDETIQVMIDKINAEKDS